MILSIIWGASFLFIKLLVGDLGPWGVVFWRCFFGTITLCLVLFLFKREDLKTVRKKRLPWIFLFLVAVFNNTLPFGLIAISELKISSSFASVINATTPIWTIVIGATFFRVHLSFKQLVGVITGFIGILLLLDLELNKVLKENFVGAGTMVLATFCYGLGAQMARRYLADVPIIIVSLITLFFSSAISFLFMLFSESGVIMPAFTPELLMSLIGLGVFGSGIAYLFYYYMVKEGSAEFASLVTYIVPITAMFWGYLLLSEKISANMIIGLFVVFLGVYLSTSRTKKRRLFILK